MFIEIYKSMFPDFSWTVKFLLYAEGNRLMSMYVPTATESYGQCDLNFFLSWCKENHLMFLNLFPDMSRKAYEANDTFIFAAPINANSWTLLHKFARQTPEGARYLTPEDIPGLNKAVIILRDRNMTDDMALTTAAYIRVVEQARDRIYVVAGKNLTDAELIDKTAGAPRALSVMLTVDQFALESKENANPQTL